MGHLGCHKKHGGSVLACGHASAATNTGRSFEGLLGDRLWDGNRVCVRGPSRSYGNKATGRDDPVKGGSVDHKVLDDGKGSGTPRLDDDSITVPEAAHVQLACGNPAQRPVRAPVDVQAARSADAFAAIMIERDRVFALPGQSEIEHVEHLEKRHVRRNVGKLVGDEPALAVPVFLPPDFQRNAHDRAHFMEPPMHAD